MSKKRLSLDQHGKGERRGRGQALKLAGWAGLGGCGGGGGFGEAGDAIRGRLYSEE